MVDANDRARAPESIFIKVVPWVWALASWLCGGIALVFCFRGQGHHYWWILTAGAVPVLRLLVSTEYRKLVREVFVSCWQSLAEFHANPASVPWRAVILYGCLPFAILFLANTKKQVGDNVPVFLAAGSIVRDGNVELSEYLGLPQWSSLGNDEKGLNYSLVRTPGGVYSNYPSGPLQIATPVALVSRCVGANFDIITVHDRLQKFSAVLLASACLGLFFLLALHLVPPTHAWIATLMLGVASAMFSTLAMGIWQHGGVVFWSLVFLVAEFRQAPRSSWAWTLAQGLALGWMVPWRPTSVLVALPLAIWLACRSPKRVLLVGALAAAAYLPWGCFYYSCYGNVLGPSHTQAHVDNWMWDSPDGYLGVLFSPGRGMFVFQPWLILALLWTWPAVWPTSESPRGQPGWGGLLALSGAIVLLNVVTVGAWRCWWGGWCYGSRLTSDTLALAALLCVQPVAYLWRFPIGRAIVVGLIALGFLIHASSVYFGADNWNGAHGDIDANWALLWRWDDPPFLYPILKHFHGRDPSTP
jgi:hypothetical protein